MNLSPLALHILNASHRHRRPDRTQWWIVIPAMLLVVGAIMEKWL